jgi:hypothetical protein
LISFTLIPKSQHILESLLFSRVRLAKVPSYSGFFEPTVAGVDRVLLWMVLSVGGLDLLICISNPSVGDLFSNAMS